MFFDRKRERGQVLLVVVLASVVALTIGLAAISRTITNTKVTTEEQNSQKALSAAEAGVEELTNNSAYVATGTTGKKNLSNSSSYTSSSVTMTPVSPYAVNGGQLISKDDGADIWLSHYPDYSSPWSGSLTVYWQSDQANCQTKEAAVEIIVLSGSVATPDMHRYAVDACGSRRANNGFSSPTAVGVSILGGTYNSFQINPAVSSGIIARVIPLYNDTKLAIGFTGSLPSQGTIITSTGASGETKRTIQAVKGYPRVPVELFPYNIFLPK